MRVFNLNRTK